MKKLFSLLFVALLTLSAGAATVTDVITASDLAATGTTYTDFSGVKKNTAVYAGQSAKSAAGAIQLRSKNSNSGIVSTTSGGKLVSVKINVESGANTIDVYGSNTAYTAASDLYDSSKQGTKVGSTAETATITVDGDYEYVGIRSNNGAVYISSIEVTWETDGGTTPVVDKVATPTFTPYNADGYHFTGSLAVTVSCSTENAAIALYKVVDGEIDYSTYQYIFQSGEVYVTENTTFAAVATKGGCEDSEEARATYVLDGDNPDPQVPEYITFVGGDFTSTTGAFSIEKSGVTIACTNGSVGTDQIRFYKSSEFSFTSTAGNITKIEFTCTANNDAQYGPGCVTLNEGEAGTYSYDAKVGTWTGSDTIVNFTATANQMRTTEIRVWIDGEIVVVVNAPTFNPASGKTFTDSLDVTITGPVGSNIVYIVGDGEEVTAASPVTVTLFDTAEIIAYAEMYGVESDIVNATYTKEDAPIYEPWEGTESYLASRDKGNFSGTAGAFNVYKAERPGINLAISNGTIAADQGVEAYRIYKNQTITFTSLVGNITMIEFIGVSSNPVSNFGEVEGMTYDGNNGIWIGDAATVTFTATKAQVRCTEIRVTVGERPAILYAPVITPENNTVFAGSQEVTITCATEGAQVYYMINDGEATLYTAPFPISESCKVSAYSVLGEQTSTTVSANYILGTEINNIADEKTVDNFYIYNGEAVVTYQDKNNGNTWIRDNSGSIVIFGYYVPTMEQGDVIEAGWTAKYAIYKNVPEFTNPNGVTKSEDDPVTVEPLVRETLTEANVNEYVVLKGITVLTDESNTKKFYNAADSLVLYNQFNIADSVLNIENGKTYDVEGIVYIFNETTQLYITNVTEVAAQQWALGDVNHDTFVNVADVTALIKYILTSGAEPEEFYTEQANVDGDEAGVLNVADVTSLIQVVLNQ